MHIQQMWIERCAGVLGKNLPEQNVLEKLHYRYTCPAREKGTYLPQWLWDSCFHAIVYRWFDPDMAWEELQSLLMHQFEEGPDTGMVPHMSHLAENRALSAQQLFQNKNSSTITQPPLISIAALAVHKKAPNKNILAKLYPKLLAYHDWFDRRRDDDHDGLAAIIHPWESGWDASQRWDSLMGLHACTKEELFELEQKRKNLVSILAAHKYDAKTLAHVPEGFYAEPADFNAIRAADLIALAEIAGELGKIAESRELEMRAKAVQQAVHDKMISFKDGELFVHDLLGASEEKSAVDHAGKFVLLFCQCLSASEAESISLQLFRSADCYATPFRVPSTSRFDALFNPKEYWRGNVWLPVNWLILRGLLSYGYKEKAHTILEDSISLVQNSGFCEFFDPITGKAGEKYGQSCPRNQSWSTIVLDMVLDSEQIIEGKADE
jgi:hypothetical protein